MIKIKDATYFDAGGYFPQGTRCPWRKGCHIAQNCRAASEDGLKQKFSCGLARAFAACDPGWTGRTKN